MRAKECNKLQKMKEVQIETEIQKKWKEIINLFIKGFDSEKYKIETKEDKQELYKLEIVKRGKKRTSSPFIIHYKEKNIHLVSGRRKGAKILVQFISMVGVDDVYKLNIKAKRSGVLISKSIEGNENNCPVLVDDKYIFTKSENEEKIWQIETIIKKLNIDAFVERVNI